MTEEQASRVIQRAWKAASAGARWRALVGEYVKSAAAARGRRRLCVLKEIESSEASYVAALELLVGTYYEPLKALAASNSPVVSREQLDRIFQNAPVILRCNSAFLKQLRARRAEWPRTTCVGDLFLPVADMLRVYIPYVNGAAAGMALCERCLRENTLFREFTSEAAERLGDTHELNSYLIAPVQRIPRYQLLLQDLLACTDPAHRDYDNIVRALTKVRALAETINERKRAADAAQMVVELQSALLEPVPLAEPSRKMLLAADCAALAVEPAGTPAAKALLASSSAPHHLVLFTNALLLLQRAGTAQYHYLDMWPLVSVRVSDQAPLRMPLQDAARCFVLTVSNAAANAHSATGGVQQQLELVVTMATAEDKAQWVAAVADALRVQSDSIHHMRALSSRTLEPRKRSMTASFARETLAHELERQSAAAAAAAASPLSSCSSSSSDSSSSSSSSDVRPATARLPKAPSAAVPRWLVRAAALSPSNSPSKALLPPPLSPLVEESATTPSPDASASFDEPADGTPAHQQQQEQFASQSLFAVLSDTVHQQALEVAHAQVAVAAAAAALDALAASAVEKNHTEMAQKRERRVADDLARQVAQARQELAQARHLAATTEAERHAARGRLEAQCRAAAKARSDLAAAQQALDSSRAKLARVASKRSQALTLAEAHKNCADELEREIALFESRARTLVEQAARTHEQAAEAQAELARNQEELKKAVAQQQALEERLDTAQSKRDKLEAEQQQLWRRVAAEERALEKLRRAAAAAAAEMAQVSSTKSELLERVLREESAVQQAQERVNELRAQVDERAKKAQQLGAETVDAKKSVRATRAELAQLQEKEQQAAAQREQLRLERLDVLAEANLADASYRQAAASNRAQQCRRAVAEARFDELKERVELQRAAVAVEGAALSTAKDLLAVFAEKQRQTDKASSTLAQCIAQLDETRQQLAQCVRPPAAADKRKQSDDPAAAVAEQPASKRPRKSSNSQP